MPPAPSTPDPALGPRILFFSGGTALRGVSRLLPAWTERSIHLLTPFDSGGSSAALRRSLGMPAVGDLRNRLLALADVSSPRGRAVHDLLGHRLPPSGSSPSLLRTVVKVLRKLPPEAVDPAHACLAAVGPRFDLRHASVGNLVLAGMYLTEERRLHRAVARFARLVGARGTVCPVSGEDLHLAAELGDGSVVVGQHRITAAGAAEPPIRRIFLVRSLGDPTPVRASAPAEALALIQEADLVCFPMGSFFTSVVASLLPDGIGEAVAGSAAPRVYLPNPGGDPEERGWSLEERVRALALHLGPLDASAIHVLSQVALSPWAPERYEDAAVVEALARIVGS
ncbi:MAG TPA: 2-phospho-L-lactate transferase CofD family protein [Longimicrobiales bacterium]|nr:2-phospho-L-lactate transferase CofD family protein [Longimicrobiales bacterium]